MQKYMSAFSAKKINEYLQLLNLYGRLRSFKAMTWSDNVDILEANPTDTSVSLCFYFHLLHDNDHLT